MNTPLVSVACITYNHEKYIAQAIEGFLLQKTSFPIEIIIHDDASTDNTKKIVEQYAKIKPNLIFPIYQQVNQYSLGKKMFANYVFPNCRGKYIALCEGDDYWTDPYKLQKQVDFLEANPDIDICFHPAIMNDVAGATTDKLLGNHAKENKIFTVQEVIRAGGGFMPTASLLIRRSSVEDLVEKTKSIRTRDYFLQILGSVSGGAYYMNDVMTVYRTNVPGGWTLEKKKNDVAVINHCQYLLEDNVQYSNFFNQKYKQDFFVL